MRTKLLPICTLGKRLETARAMRKKTASEVAEAIGVSPSAVCRIERGGKMRRATRIRLERLLLDWGAE